ncbi:MAG TPA: hypothetical protein VLV54_18715 [Thermoanaerobaculia bacterium]|nr:hypothetical protein [Thermoanaerobaculia bacterium]
MTMADYFNFEEAFDFDPDLLVRVLRGKLAGVIFRKLITPDICQQIVANFWASSALRKRTDAVPASYVGTFHYGKALETYLLESESTREGVGRLFEGTKNVVQKLLGELGEQLKKEEVDLRLARYQGRSAGAMLVRSWQNDGKFSLNPHEDGAQLRTTLQAGFEIEKVAAYSPVAANFCLANSESGGELHFWNWKPTDDDRRRLGLLETGYPYPPELLENIDRMVIPIRTGDAYFFNGGHIHAVGTKASSGSLRLTISFLMGFSDPNTVIYWT